MKKQNLLLVAALLAWMTPTSASAQSLGLNFAADDPDTATSSLNPTDVAGVVPAANWNNLFGASGNATGLVYNNNGSPVNSGQHLARRRQQCVSRRSEQESDQRLPGLDRPDRRGSLLGRSVEHRCRAAQPGL
jgi:hypothetical protein